MCAEEWTDIEVPGFEIHYQISNNGRVRNKCYNLLSQKDRRGYKVVILSRMKPAKSYSVARLVALAFISNPENKAEVNHINGIKTDNRAENLEWVTSSENTQHSLRTGLIPKFSHSYNAKRKISISRKGSRHSDETRKKISESMKGKQNALRGGEINE